jgi:hypothetical protein
MLGIGVGLLLQPVTVLVSLTAHRRSRSDLPPMGPVL